MATATGVRSVNHWIGGHVIASKSGRSGAVWNPATGEAQAHVDFASAEEVDHAVAAAKKAFPAWRATALSRRSEIAFRVSCHAKRTYRFRHEPAHSRALVRASVGGMEEAEHVLERLRRIDALQREQAPAAALLAEVRELVAEAEAWLEVEPAGARAEGALERCRGALGEPALPP